MQMRCSRLPLRCSVPLALGHAPPWLTCCLSSLFSLAHDARRGQVPIPTHFQPSLKPVDLQPVPNFTSSLPPWHQS